MNDPRLEHQTLKVRQLIDDYRTGRVVVPEFQREYVWKPTRAPLLIDSLYRGYPISSLLLWQGGQDARPRHVDPRLVRSPLVSWLIDGQQRVITLSRAMSGDEGIDVVFNPDRDRFRLANAATKKGRGWFRIADLWDDELYRQLRRNLSDAQSADRHEASFERVRRILDYEVPTVRMADQSFENAVTAFTRINQLGVRLKKEDLQSAAIAARHTGFIVEQVVPFLDELRREGLTRLNVMHLFRACAFIAKPDARDRTPLHGLDKGDVLAAWKRTEKATEQAIEVTRSELGLEDLEILRSGAILVPLIVMFATGKPGHRGARELAGWMVLASLLRRYSESSGTALDQDIRACRSADPVGSLLTNLRKVRASLVATPDDFSGKVTDRAGLLCLHIACMHRGAMDFSAGGQSLRRMPLERAHILPRGQLSAAGRSGAEQIANIVFVAPNAKNKHIAVAAPEFFLKRIGKDVLRSQCVPEDPALWPIDRADDFWAERRRLLAISLNEFLHTALAERRLGHVHSAQA